MHLPHLDRGHKASYSRSGAHKLSSLPLSISLTRATHEARVPMSHYTTTHVSSRSSRAPRSGETVVYTNERRSRSRTRASPPVVYSTTRRSSSVGAGTHRAPSTHYTVSDAGQIRRHSSLDRGRAYYPPASTHYASTHHARAPSSHGSHHQRRSSSQRGTSPAYYTMPPSSAYGRPRASSSSSHAYVDARRSDYPRVHVMVHYCPFERCDFI